MANAGLTLNAAKTKVWTPDASTDLPPELGQLRVGNLSVLGAPATWYDCDDDDGDARLPLLTCSDGRETLSKTTKFLDNWRALRANGLSAESSHTLLRTFALGCATHLLRANYETAWVAELDGLLLAAYSELTGPLTDAQKEQLSLRFSDGGNAFPSAKEAAARAYLGSWALCFRGAAVCLGATSAESFRSRCPRTAQAQQRAEADLDSQGAKCEPLDWAAFLAEPRGKLQGYWAERTSQARRGRLLQSLDEDGRLALRGASGVGAGSWLLPRQSGDEPMPDSHFL
eukprot:1079627-Alexandrium_andersonii.AAC.1